MRRRFHLLCVTVLLVGAVFVFSACGKKGPLYLPDEAKPARGASVR